MHVGLVVSIGLLLMLFPHLLFAVIVRAVVIVAMPPCLAAHLPSSWDPSILRWSWRRVMSPELFKEMLSCNTATLRLSFECDRHLRRKADADNFTSFHGPLFPIRSTSTSQWSRLMSIHFFGISDTFRFPGCHDLAFTVVLPSKNLKAAGVAIERGSA